MHSYYTGFWLLQCLYEHRENFAAYPAEKHMSKNELCVKTGLNKGYMYRLENDLISPTFATLEKVAQALEEPLSKLVKEAEHAASCAVYADVSSAESWGSAAESGTRK